MINSSIDKLKLIAQCRNISNYENKFKKNLIKVLSKTKPETPKTPKPETPKIQKPKLEIRVNKKILKKLRQDFDELRHKFSKKEIGRYRKAFYVA